MKRNQPKVAKNAKYQQKTSKYYKKRKEISQNVAKYAIYQLKNQANIA